MVAINWNSTGKRSYEAGLDRVVLYTQTNDPVPWFGFRSYEESISGGEAEPYYIDGIKYLNIPSPEDYKASISSVGYPQEFRECDGSRQLAAGLIVTQQERRPFSLSYRTQVGSDTRPLGTTYRLHLVYNLLASPSNRSHATLQKDPSMETNKWSVTSKPIPYPGVKPISHLIIDSSAVVVASRLTTVERYLYGTSTITPRLLDPGQIVAILSGETVDFED